MQNSGRVAILVVLAVSLCAIAGAWCVQALHAGEAAPAPGAKLPKLLDLGAKTCIPCKQMAPILEELTKEYAGKFDVEFVDVSVKENLPRARAHGIKLIPTQIFLDAAGAELWRHEGFLSKEAILGKWKELGFAFAAAPAAAGPVFERLVPAQPEARAKDRICYMCDGDVEAKTRVAVATDKGAVGLCSPHCYFILYSCLTEDKADHEKKVTVTDWASGVAVPAAQAVYLYTLDGETGRPVVKAFGDREAALKVRAASGGSITSFAALKARELSHRCGFCDRACYPEDAAMVTAGGLQTWGCCSHCALGVAARTGKDIEVRERDRLTGEEIVVKTANGAIASIEPATAVAWFGQRKNAEGAFVSAGCFHQGFFATPENLKKWVEAHPRATGRMISIAQALADKMKLTPEQIGKACKIGECAPR